MIFTGQILIKKNKKKTNIFLHKACKEGNVEDVQEILKKRHELEYTKGEVGNEWLNCTHITYHHHL